MTLMFNPPEAKIFGGSRDPSYPAPIELLHISIFHTGPGIDDLVNFYQVVLNMRYVYKYSYPNFEFIALSQDDENHRLGFVNSLSGEPPGGIGFNKPSMELPEGVDARDAPLRQCRLEHTSWLYRDFEAVLLTAKRIHEELGIWPRSTRHAGTDLTIDYNDPDGNRVELLSQTATKAEILFRIHRQSTAREDDKRQFSESYMMIDMEKLLALYESGMPISEMQDRELCRKLRDEGKL